MRCSPVSPNLCIEHPLQLMEFVRGAVIVLSGPANRLTTSESIQRETRPFSCYRGLIRSSTVRPMSRSRCMGPNMHRGPHLWFLRARFGVVSQLSRSRVWGKSIIHDVLAASCDELASPLEPPKWKSSSYLELCSYIKLRLMNI
jgi:hypothetical protein